MAFYRTAMVTGTLALLLGTLAQLVSPWYFDMITAFIPKWYSKNLLPSTLTTVTRWLKIVRVPGTASLESSSLVILKGKELLQPFPAYSVPSITP